MSKVYLQDSTLTSIGSAIREKLNVETTYLPSEMPTAIRSIEGGGGGVSLVPHIYAPGITVNRSAAPTTTAQLVNFYFFQNDLVRLVKRDERLHLFVFGVLPYNSIENIGEYGVDYTYLWQVNNSYMMSFDITSAINECPIPKEDVHIVDGADFNSDFANKYIWMDLDIMSLASSIIDTYQTGQTSSQYILRMYEHGVDRNTNIVATNNQWPAGLWFLPIITKKDKKVNLHFVYEPDKTKFTTSIAYNNTLKEIYANHPEYSTVFYETYLNSSTGTGTRYTMTGGSMTSIYSRNSVNNCTVILAYPAIRGVSALSSGSTLEFGGGTIPMFGGDTEFHTFYSTVTTTPTDQCLAFFSIDDK